MHLVFITSEFPYKNSNHGGVGSFLKTFSKQLIKRNFKVTIVYFNDLESGCSEFERINLILIRRSKVRGLAWFINFHNLNKSLSNLHNVSPISIVEGAEMSFSFIKKIVGVKYLIRLHGGHHFFSLVEKRKINPWKGFQEKFSFVKADAFIGVSEFSVTETAKYLDFGDRPLKVINYPISFSQFRPRPDISVIPFSLAFAGTICEKKGVRQLLMAIRLLKNEYPDIHLNFYGRDWTYPNGKSYTAEMMELFKDISVYYTFHGVINYDKLPLEYAKAEICIFPSHSETQGLVAPESMAMEKPVIFTELGPGPETICHGIDGWLCNPFDPVDIYEKVKFAFHSRDTFPEIGKNARNKVLKKFSLETTVTNNIDFYRFIYSL